MLYQRTSVLRRHAERPVSGRPAPLGSANRKPSSGVVDGRIPGRAGTATDVVARLADGRLHHLEIQTGPDSDMPWRMLEYYSLITRLFGEPPVQQLLYAGSDRTEFAGGIDQEALQYRYQVIHLGEVDGSTLLESDSLEDNLLAVLCRLEDSRAAVRRILSRLGGLPRRAAADAISQLVILCRLRGLPGLLLEERKHMPIPIPEDILEHPWLQELLQKRLQEVEARGEAKGEAKGEASLLRRQMERRYGELPDWALRRLESADSGTLEKWGLRLLDAASLQEVFE